MLAVRDAQADRIAGFVSRAIRSMFVNGSPEPIGYLSGLRALPEYRNRGLLARGIVYLRRLHSDGRAKLYLATIAEGNDGAIRLLTSGRTGLPTFHSAGQYLGLALPIPTRSRGASLAAGELTLSEARREDLSEILQFLRKWGPRRQFFPDYRDEDFFRADATFKDLAPRDILLARRKGQLIGTIGAWDQHGFKQSIVEGYGTALKWFSPVYNLWSQFRARPAIPRPGSELRYLTCGDPRGRRRQRGSLSGAPAGRAGTGVGGRISVSDAWTARSRSATARCPQARRKDVFRAVIFGVLGGW